MIGRQPRRGIDRQAAMPELELETGRSIRSGDNLAQGLSGNYAGASTHVKPSHSGHYDMISPAAIDDQ